MKKPRLLLADDHTLLLEAFRRLLEEDFEVVACVTDGAELVAEALRLQPDVVVTDVSMPRMGGFEAVRRLRDLAPSIRVVFLTVNEDPQLASEAFSLGASAWVLKSSTATELVGAVRDSLERRRYLSRGIAGGDVARLPRPAREEAPAERLTPREREVLQLLAEGKVMKEVGAILGISTRTVAETLGIRSSAELIQFAVRNRVV